MQGREPDRLYVDKADIGIYRETLNDSFLRGRENRELFMIALAYGIKNDLRIPIEQKEEFVRREYLRQDEWAILYSIAYAKLGVEKISDLKEIFKIAEEYAHGGIKLLKDRINSIHGPVTKDFELELRELYEDFFT